MKLKSLFIISKLQDHVDSKGLELLQMLLDNEKTADTSKKEVDPEKCESCDTMLTHGYEQREGGITEHIRECHGCGNTYS